MDLRSVARSRSSPRARLAGGQAIRPLRASEARRRRGKTQGSAKEGEERNYGR